jgi:hypothetical protein
MQPLRTAIGLPEHIGGVGEGHPYVEKPRSKKGNLKKGAAGLTETARIRTAEVQETTRGEGSYAALSGVTGTLFELSA